MQEVFETLSFYASHYNSFKPRKYKTVNHVCRTFEYDQNYES